MNESWVYLTTFSQLHSLHIESNKKTTVHVSWFI